MATNYTHCVSLVGAVDRASAARMAEAVSMEITTIRRTAKWHKVGGSGPVVITSPCMPIEQRLQADYEDAVDISVVATLSEVEHLREFLARAI